MLKNLESLLEQKFGFGIDKSLRNRLLEYIHKRCKELKISLGDFFILLENEKDSEEWNKLIDELTINESYFFRIPQHFEFLSKIIVELVEKKEKINILSEGCCTGEEPYTIAIVLKENLSPEALKKIEILGTDVNRKNLAMAKEGIFSKRKVSFCPENIKNKYFTFKNNKYYLSNEIKKMCIFKYHNLLDYNYLNYFGKKFDIIFFRNVMIYFKKDTNIKIMEEMYKLLEEDGYLFTGASESLWGINDDFIVDYYKDTFYYRKKESIKKEKEKKKIPSSKFEGISIIKRDSISSKLPDKTQGSIKTILPALPQKEDELRELAKLIENGNFLEFEKKMEKFKGEILDKNIIFLKGLYYFRTDNISQAIREFKKLTFLDIDLIAPRFFLKFCFKKLKKIEEEERENKNILQLIDENRYKRLPVEKYISETKDLNFEEIEKLLNTEKFTQKSAQKI